MTSKGQARKGAGKGRASARDCPICGKPPLARFRPFCSRRCADLDLGRWLKGRYAVPTDEAPREGGEEE